MKRIRTEVVIVGSGPGGAVTACTLASAGRDVVVLEEGPRLPTDQPLNFTQEEMLSSYRDGGLTAAFGPLKIAFAEACVAGGGSEVNAGLYHRTPETTLVRWARDYNLQRASATELETYFAGCESSLSVSICNDQPLAEPARLMLEGAHALNWQAREVPRWFKNGRRQSMSVTYLPRAERAGAQLVAGVRATKLLRVGRGWRIEAFDAHGSPICITATSVFVCCGSLQTPLILRRSGIRRNVGNHLRLQPMLKVVAEFPRPVNEHNMGVPAVQVSEFSTEMTLGCSVSTPAFMAIPLLAHGLHHHFVRERWQHLAQFYVSVRSIGHGKVRGYLRHPSALVHYRCHPEDMAALAQGFKRLVELLFAAGAVRIYPGIQSLPVLNSLDDLEDVGTVLPYEGMSLSTVHLTSTCPMGENPERCATDSFGRVRETDGLYISDSSLLCDAPGVNPQGSVTAIALRNAERFLES